MEHEKENKCCCQECIKSGEEESDFCIPHECCPKRIPQPKFSSPTSCLPKEQIREVDELIMKANQLLLDLGLEKREIREVQEKAFKRIEGLHVEVILDNEQNQIVSGTVKLVGFDFVILLGESQTLIQYENVKYIQTDGELSAPEYEENLSRINPCLKRDLTFEFGKTVAFSPELIQIFFGLTLVIYLMLVVEKNIDVIFKDGEIKSGKLCKVSSDSFSIVKEGEEKEIPLASVLYITIKK